MCLNVFKTYILGKSFLYMDEALQNALKIY